jgi:hypothetical protein
MGGEGEKTLDKRQKAIEELQKQIREQRGRLDPKVLKIAEEALQAAQSGQESHVAYDRKSATAAVELFLTGHKDADGFKRRLLEMLGRHSH